MARGHCMAGQGVAAPAAGRCVIVQPVLRSPAATIGMVLLLVALFHHTALGLQVVVQDYIHSGAKFAAIIAINLCCFAFAVAGIVAVLRIGFSG